MTADRDVEKSFSLPEFVAELRRLADALEAGEGFEIEIDTSRPHPRRLKQLDAIEVHPWFSERYSRDQLAITSIDFVGRKASRAS